MGWEDCRQMERDEAENAPLILELTEMNKKWREEREEIESKTIRTPLSKAVSDSNLILVQNLLKQQDIDINEWDGDGRTPLEAAILLATGHNFEFVRLLIESGADINKKIDSYPPVTPFCAACKIAAGNVELLQYMLEHGADTKGALSAASLNGDMVVVQV